jgi:hypothetical protein
VALTTSAIYVRKGGHLRHLDRALYNLRRGGLLQSFSPESPLLTAKWFVPDKVKEVGGGGSTPVERTRT